jgi:hypothetical protein
VGVLVNFPDGTIKTACVEAADNENGYSLMQKTGFSLLWAGPSTFGHALCRIDGVGDDVNGDYCSYSGKYWGFFIADQGAWAYMPVGWDAGDSCWNGDPNSYEGHYCAKDGDVMGYRYGEFGVMPVYRDFSEICPTKKKSGGEKEAVIEWSERKKLDGEDTLHVQANEAVEFTLKDEKTGETIEDVSVDVRDNKLQKLFTVAAEDDGKIRVQLDKEGEYRLLIMARNYPHKQITVTVEKQETTTSSSTTTVTQTTTSTTTTTKLPHFLSIEKETSTTTVEQTTTTEAVSTTSSLETTTTQGNVAVTGDIVQSGRGNRTRNVAVILTAILAAGVLLLTRER